MTQLFISPLTKYTTDTLQSLPYATLSFFVNNSSTTKEVWADKSKATSRGSIVTADSAGIFPPIWLDGAYRVTLKSKSTTISDSPATGIIQTGWPVDNVGDNVNFTAFSVWDATYTYTSTTNKFVTGSDGFYYEAIILPSLNKNPISEPTYWQQIYFLPLWNASVNYASNVILTHLGSLYKSTTVGGNLNRTPPNATYWENLLSSVLKTAKKIVATSRISTTTIAADPDLTLVTEAATYYAFKAVIPWDGQGSTTNGIKLQVATSSGTVLSQIAIANTNATAVNADPTSNETRSSGAAFSKLPNSAASLESITLEGVILTTNIGTIHLEWSQAASVAVNTRVNIGSFLTITKL